MYTYVLRVSIGPRAETKPAAPFTLLVLWFYRRGREGHAVYTILYSGLKPAAPARLPPTGLAQDLQNLAVAVLGGHGGGRGAFVIGCPQVGPCLARGCSLHIQGVEAGPRLFGLRKSRGPARAVKHADITHTLLARRPDILRPFASLTPVAKLGTNSCNLRFSTLVNGDRAPLSSSACEKACTVFRCPGKFQASCRSRSAAAWPLLAASHAGVSPALLLAPSSTLASQREARKHRKAQGPSRRNCRFQDAPSPKPPRPPRGGRPELPGGRIRRRSAPASCRPHPWPAGRPWPAEETEAWAKDGWGVRDRSSANMSCATVHVFFESTCGESGLRQKGQTGRAARSQQRVIDCGDAH